MQILLASMPWAIFNRPSIQLSALQGYLRTRDPDLQVETSHPYLTAAEEIGLETYRIISENPWAGEAIYCSLLFPERYERAEKVFRRSLDPVAYRTLPDFDKLASQLDRHMDRWLTLKKFAAFGLVGFSVCFSQLPATLLAVRRLKKLSPQLPIVLGGSTCAPEIGRGLLKIFPRSITLSAVKVKNHYSGWYDILHVKKTGPGKISNTNRLPPQIPPRCIMKRSVTFIHSRTPITMIIFPNCRTQEFLLSPHYRSNFHEAAGGTNALFATSICNGAVTGPKNTIG